MPNHRQQLARDRHIASSTSAYRQHSRRHESGGDREFSFWGASNNTTSSENACDQVEGWSREGYGVRGYKFEESPLLPSSSNNFGSVSPTSRSEVIAEGRKELMQMIQDMPESGFELSFQDMVDQQQATQPAVQNKSLAENTVKDSSNEDHMSKQDKKKKMKKSKKPDHMLQVEGMDSETFILKMFFPTSLARMKKGKVDNISRLSSPPSFRESTKKVSREKRIKESFKAGDNRSYVKDRTSESTTKSGKRSKKSR